MNTTIDLNELKRRAHKLGLYGLLSEWDSVVYESWLPMVIQYEEVARSSRGLERRINEAKLGKFKPLSDFDWTWPKQIDRVAIEQLLSIDFVREAENVIIVGPNGVGKTMLATNLAHCAILQGFSALLVSASQLLNDLAAQDSPSALRRRLNYYARPHVLVIDELGYLATTADRADLLFELVTKRYQNKSTIITSNKSFQDWQEVFPNASSVVALVDRLIHKSEIITIAADSFRCKEANERKLARANLNQRNSKKTTARTK